MPSFSEADACASSSRPKMSTERMESGLQAAFKDARNLGEAPLVILRVDRRCIAHDSGRPCLSCRARSMCSRIRNNLASRNLACGRQVRARSPPTGDQASSSAHM